MGFRQCECILKLSDGRNYTATVMADSVYRAALAFQEYCADPLFPHRPRITADTELEIKPVYRVQMAKVLKYADWYDGREGKKARSQR
jgi:hypothetical protein